jgi:hypothetical protein
MENSILREWQECWYEIGLKSVQSQLSPIQFAINELRQEISKLSASGDQLKFFDYIYPSMSQRLGSLEGKFDSLEIALKEINQFMKEHFGKQKKKANKK